MSINKTSNESKQQKFHKRDLQHICAEHNSENSGTCEHICVFIDNCDRNVPIVPNEINNAMNGTNPNPELAVIPYTATSLSVLGRVLVAVVLFFEHRFIQHVDLLQRADERHPAGDAQQHGNYSRRSTS